MADRILRWFVSGGLGAIKLEVGGTHRLDADYKPVLVHLSTRRPTKGDRPLKIDIRDDGVSIFDDKPALNADSDKVWTTIPGDTMGEESIIKLDISQTASEDPGEDLTVELELEKV